MKACQVPIPWLRKKNITRDLFPYKRVLAQEDESELSWKLFTLSVRVDWSKDDVVPDQMNKTFLFPRSYGIRSTTTREKTMRERPRKIPHSPWLLPLLKVITGASVLSEECLTKPSLYKTLCGCPDGPAMTLSKPTWDLSQWPHQGHFVTSLIGCLSQISSVLMWDCHLQAGITFRWCPPSLLSFSDSR